MHSYFQPSKARSTGGAKHWVEQVVARQSILSLKAALRKMTLDENEIEEVMARAGLQPEEPQYGVRTKGELDERTAERYVLADYFEAGANTLSAGCAM